MPTDFSDFWSWSLDRYERNGAAETLLRLQDEYALNVNLLLWCCWCAEFYEPLSDPLAQQAGTTTKLWNERVTGPLRSVRRYLKSGEEAEKKQRKTLRKNIKDAELLAEKVEQTRLETLATNQLRLLADQPSSETPADRARANLTTYTKQAGIDDASSVMALLNTLIATVFNNGVADAPERQG